MQQVSCPGNNIIHERLNRNTTDTSSIINFITIHNTYEGRLTTITGGNATKDEETNLILVKRLNVEMAMATKLMTSLNFSYSSLYRYLEKGGESDLLII